jgi:hypothetical protein
MGLLCLRTTLQAKGQRITSVEALHGIKIILGTGIMEYRTPWRLLRDQRGDSLSVQLSPGLFLEFIREGKSVFINIIIAENGGNAVFLIRIGFQLSLSMESNSQI